MIQITIDVMKVPKPLLSTSALTCRGVKIMFNHDYDHHFEDRESEFDHDCHAYLHIILANGILMVPRETRCQEASAGDRRAIADAEQTEQLDITGEPRTAKHYAMRFQAQEEDSVERAALRHRFHRSAIHGHKGRLVNKEGCS